MPNSVALNVTTFCRNENNRFTPSSFMPAFFMDFFAWKVPKSLSRSIPIWISFHCTNFQKTLFKEYIYLKTATRPMSTASVITLLFFVLLVPCTGFRLSHQSPRNTLARNAINRDSSQRKNTFDELLYALVEAFPAVLNPLKEMDTTRIISNPPKFMKVWCSC